MKRRRKKDPRSPLSPQAAVLERKGEQDRGRERTRAEGKTSHLKGVAKEEEAMREEGPDQVRPRATGPLLQDASVVAGGSFTTTGFQCAVRAWVRKKLQLSLDMNVHIDVIKTGISFLSMTVARHGNIAQTEIRFEPPCHMRQAER